MNQEIQQRLDYIDELNWHYQDTKEQLKWWIGRNALITEKNISGIYRYVCKALMAMYPEDEKNISLLFGEGIREKADVKKSNLKKVTMSWENEDHEVQTAGCDGCIQMMEANEKEKWLQARTPKELLAILKVKRSKDIDKSRLTMLQETYRIYYGKLPKMTPAALIKKVVEEVFPELRG